MDAREQGIKGLEKNGFAVKSIEADEYAEDFEIRKGRKMAAISWKPGAYNLGTDSNSGRWIAGYDPDADDALLGEVMQILRASKLA